MKRTTRNELLVNDGEIRRENFEGREHLVVPVIAVREGVLNGMLVLFEEFSAYVDAWEGVPLPIDHPRKNGSPVTANTINVLETQVIGTLFNVHADKATKSLKGEMWIDVEKAGKHADGPEVLRRLEANEPLEVSTGYFADLEVVSGIHEGKRYAGIQRNMRPDHLALLPNSKGACSWDMGCGSPRTAEQETERGELMFANTADLQSSHNETRFTLTNQDISHDETARILRSALDAEEGNAWHWLQDVFDDFVIYEREGRGVVPVPNEAKLGLFKRSYSIVDSKVTFGEAAKVARKISYVEVPATNDRKEQVKEEAPPMADKKKELVDQIIAHAETPWKEDHRESLMTINECELAKLLPKVAAPAPAVNEDKKEEKPKPQTTAEVLANIADPKIRKVIEDGIKANERRHSELVAQLTANKSVAFSETELKAMDVEFLEKLADSFDISYAGVGSPRVNRARPEVNDDEGVPDPPKILTAPMKAAS